VGKKLLGELRFVMEQAYHDRLLQANDGASLKSSCGGHAHPSARQATFTEEAAFRQDGEDGLLREIVAVELVFP
jgi:hypothetical protein